ncbi:GNAT family N-acetyltransferase [Vibrio sp. SCSIO 43136]|uniref:GNAT family N-acetyltransferase n=1 Tax=Vibrio sp. SCSIO 43136 TaxID=2819101 RepID=UPI002075E097|nr:GNAT family N-acetyltransferase [Vibrio sp. SCSIO 43136]USD66761.1 GNAT family N-acetyltransferase [Vibrio sp. SCSIO 43136]
MIFKQVETLSVPDSLLLEADPDIQSINTYRAESLSFVAVDNDTMIGVVVAKPNADHLVEILNVSVLPNFQKQGIGTKLLRFALQSLSEHGFTRVELGTGSFGYQLTYYQRLGFRIDTIVKDYFTDNYPEPIHEHGIQHRDMLRLYLDLTKK